MQDETQPADSVKGRPAESHRDEPSHAAAPPRHYLVGPLFDIGWFVVPGLVALLLALGLPPAVREHAGESLLAYVALVLLIDVAHVWSSLYRTYLDSEQRASHGARLVVIPSVCFFAAFALHSFHALLMWRVLAYIAIFHFIKQHIGIAAIYCRLGGESDFDRNLCKLTIWGTTLGAVVWWHTALPRRFAWFMQGDLVTGLPPWLGTCALLLIAGSTTAFAVRRTWLVATRAPHNPMTTALTLLTAASWFVGIVYLNSDLAFTLTNVVIHGISYLALVYVAGGATWVERWLLDQAQEPRTLRATASEEAIWSELAAFPGQARRSSEEGRTLAALSAVVFYGAVALLAFVEEAAWDRAIWHEHGELFGYTDAWLSGPATSLVVALLTLPQATHYVLDRYIWRPGADNPRLASQLGLHAPTRDQATPRG